MKLNPCAIGVIIPGLIGLHLHYWFAVGNCFPRVTTLRSRRGLLSCTPCAPPGNVTLGITPPSGGSPLHPYSHATPPPGQAVAPAAAAGLPRISLYFLNMKASHERGLAMMQKARNMRALGIETHRVAGFPVRNALFIPQLQRSGRISLNCTGYVASTPSPDPAVVDLCDSEGLGALDVDIGMYRDILPTNFIPQGGSRTLGALGCFISHLLALRRAYLSGDDYALVSEDDVTWDPFVTFVSANADLVRRTVDPAWNATVEAHTYVQALSTCAASRAGQGSQPWPPSVDQDRVRRAEAEIRGRSPVVLQLATSNGGVYMDWRRRLGRRGGDCTGNRNGCDFILQTRRYHDWGAQAVLWNRAAIEYMVHLFWDPHRSPHGHSALSFPSALPPQSQHPLTDTLFYNLPRPFGSTFLALFPMVHDVPGLSKYSTIADAYSTGGSPDAVYAEDATRGFAAYVASDCNRSADALATPPAPTPRPTGDALATPPAPTPRPTGDALATPPAPTPRPTGDALAFGNVFYCGYDEAEYLATHLFPERPRSPFPPGGGVASGADDVIVANGPCGPPEGSFAGVVLYVDGESGKIQLPQQGREVYLGVHDPPMIDARRKASFKARAVVPYMSSAALSMGLPNVTGRLLGGRQRRRKDLFVAYTQRNCVVFREHAFDELARLALAHGWPDPTPCSACHGSLPLARRRGYNACGAAGSEWATNSGLFGRFKFVLAMENRKWPGYVTEKILNAFLGDSVPIYYGADTIFEIFNSEAFIYYNVSSPGPALAKIERLMGNETAYWETFHAPVLLEGPDTIRKHFSWSDSIQAGYLKRRVRRMVFDARQAAPP